MKIQKHNSATNTTAFSGHTKYLDKQGFIKHSFYYLYDDDRYNCYVELYPIQYKLDTQGYRTNEIELADKKPLKTEKLQNGKTDIEFDYEDIDGDDILGFAYRFKLLEYKKDADGNYLLDNNRNKVEDTTNPKYAFDNGDVIGLVKKTKNEKGKTVFKRDENLDNKFNIVFKNRAIINKNGPMQLIMPDEYYPGVEKGETKPTVNDTLRASVLTSVRTHANKLGGNFYGIIKRLPDIRDEGITRIVGTPYTKDTVSSHLYWTENSYQIAPTLGNEEDFKELQRHLFSNGINWIADAALVNEGLNGIHLDSVLRKGDSTYAKDMFKGGETKVLGILPDDKNAQKYTNMKIINSPLIVENSTLKRNKNYDDKKPVYVQFYDTRLASDAQIKSDSVKAMKTYDNKNTKNPYEITKHDDAIYPFAFEVDPDKIEDTLKTTFKNKKFTDIKKIQYDAISQIMDLGNFKVVEKLQAGGLDLWAGNVDIAKLNFFIDPQQDLNKEQADSQKRASLAVRDYQINSGRYWTKLVTDTQQEFIVSELSKIRGKGSADDYLAAITKLINNDKFPKSAENIDKEIINNVLNDEYNLRKIYSADARSYEEDAEEPKYNEYTVDEYILKKSIDTPIETLTFANNLMSVITSPYIIQRPIKEEELGYSKYDLMKIRQNNPDTKYDDTTSRVGSIYENDIVPIIKEIMGDIPIRDEEGNISEYGRYVLTEVTPDLTRYILTKAIAPDADIKISKDGHFDFSGVNEEEITIQSLGIPYNLEKYCLNEKNEAIKVVEKLENGMENIDKFVEKDNIKEKIKKRFENRTLNDYKIAEMIHDRTESGLGWRIDAAKDVTNYSKQKILRQQEWDNVISFWKTYNQTILKENPHAYTTAEITDLDTIFNDEDVESRYYLDANAERKFIEQTGITCVANYNYFFSLLPSFYTMWALDTGKDGALGWDGWRIKNEDIHLLREKLVKGWDNGENTNNPGLLYQSPEDGIVNSYTFVGNHDKPRILHGLALNMSVFHGGLQEEWHQKIADKVVNPDNPSKKAGYSYDELDSKAIAMGDRIDTAIDDVYQNDKELNAQLKKAVSYLATGHYKDKTFKAGAFGTRPFEVAIKTVIDEAEFLNGKEFSEKERKDIETALLKSIMIPALDRFRSIYKMLVTLPGSPTDFAGDKVGTTGYESKAKNYFQQNRNVIHWEYLNDKTTYKFITDFNDEIKELANLRKDPDLSALNNGATVVLPIIKGFRVENVFDENGQKKLDEKGKEVMKLIPEESEKLQSVLRYNNEGSIVLCLYNNKGANTDISKTLDRKDGAVTSKEDSNEKINIYDRIILNSDIATEREGLKYGLREGMKFQNKREGDDSTYEIKKMVIKDPNDTRIHSEWKDNNEYRRPYKYKEYYYLERRDKNGKEIPISLTPEDLNTLILYNNEGAK